MLSVSAKRAIPAVGIVAALLCSCARPPDERNIAFRFESNLPVVSMEIDGHPVDLVVSTALPTTVIGGKRARAIELDLTRRRSKAFYGNLAGTRVGPVVIELDNEFPADGFLGADAWRGRAVTLDYRRGLIIIDSPGPIGEGFYSWSFKGPPRVSIRLNGIVVPAIIDTAIPDNAIIPEYLLDETTDSRAKVEIELAGVDFDELDVATAKTGDIRLGNRLLANFVVRIDYAYRTVALWQDHR